MAEAARQYDFHGRINERGFPEVSHDEHISIKDLKNALQDNTNQMQIKRDLGEDYDLKILDYLKKTIPNYPTPVEFHISEVTHATDIDGLHRIMESEGFKARGKDDDEKFSWWSLKIDEDSIQAAERRYLEKTFPNRSNEEKQTQSREILNKFTTSPAFHIDKSRYGPVRFTFPLKELMVRYKENMCEGQDPVLREYKTIFYKQEIMYVVLVHSPDDDGKFENFPKIEQSPFVDYVKDQQTNDQTIVWRAQAISNNIEFELILNEEDKTADVTRAVGNGYYVWDHVSLAFHFNDVLKFPKDTLINNCKDCALDEINIARGNCGTRKQAKRTIVRYKSELQQ